MRIPGFSQGKPLPHGPRKVYGSDETIHRTNTIDVQINKDTGQVVAVWFRCLNLPFTVSETESTGSLQPPIAIDMIAYADKEGT